MSDIDNGEAQRAEVGGRQARFKALCEAIHYARCQYVRGECPHKSTFTPKDNDVASILMAPGGWLDEHDEALRTARDTVLAQLAEAERVIASYEHRINWHTTCENCANVLDSAIRETERAEAAEAQLAEGRADA